MFKEYGEVIENCSLENYNTYGIKTSCAYLVKPSSIDNLISLLKEIKQNNYKYFLLGGGSNIILPDNAFNGVVISLELLNKVIFNETEVVAECGISIGSLAKMCIDKSLSGLENLALIPGTLGGALYGNAGVKESTIYDNLVSVKVIRENELIELKKSDINISYRYTSFKKSKDIIVSATFKLNEGNSIEMMKIVKENRLKRLNSQPLEYKNAGSVFKNPEGDYAGRLIEKVGLKGYSINGAEVSMKHANFIINKGNASSRDILDLVKLIQDKVYKKFKILLELEQIIVEWD